MRSISFLSQDFSDYKLTLICVQPNDINSTDRCLLGKSYIAMFAFLFVFQRKPWCNLRAASGKHDELPEFFFRWNGTTTFESSCFKECTVNSNWYSPQVCDTLCFYKCFKLSRCFLTVCLCLFLRISKRRKNVYLQNKNYPGKHLGDVVFIILYNIFRTGDSCWLKKINAETATKLQLGWHPIMTT